MKRALVIRLLAFELAPMVGALAVGAYSQQLLAPAFLAASLLILLSVALSVRDGCSSREMGLCVREAKRPTLVLVLDISACMLSCFFPVWRSDDVFMALRV